MFSNYFQLGSIPANQLTGSYDPRLVMLSYVVAVFASYIALDITGRLRDLNNTKLIYRMWLIGGAIAMGSGIWAMHFIGMLSFTIPNLTLQYSLNWTIFSLLVAIIASGFALYLLKSSVINIIHLVAGGVILGLAIASMHYTGMAAMLISLNIRYLPGIFLLSIIIAVLASEAAIWFALKSNTVVPRLRYRIKVMSALIMGFAICGMHYTGMAASVFLPLCQPVGYTAEALDPTFLSLAIAAVTFLILGVAFSISTYKETINQQQFERARELGGLTEIAATVLHNVGNVLNSVNVSAKTISEKISASQLIGLEKLSNLLKEHQHDLGEFITNDARGKHTLDFINQLADYWREEQKEILDEANGLIKNLALIKDIISTQQNLSKKRNKIEQLVSINQLIDEALLIAGFSIQKDITIEKQYSKINHVILDNIKLLQVLDNILRNAKHALIASSNKNKKLIIKTSVINKKTIEIEIADNGIGIPSENLEKIFIFGFTTKKDGHGFGLHTGALSISQLGGKIKVTSDGHEQGATFHITLPYKETKYITNEQY